MKRLVSLLVLCFLGYAVAGQDYVFKVMANKGSNLVRTSDGGSWKSIERGDALHAGYWVKVTSKSYLGLVHNTGKTTALENPGEFEIATIESTLKSKKKGLGAKYTDFVYEQSMEDAEDVVMTRGDSEALLIRLPADGEVIHSTIHLHWEAAAESEQYELILLDIFEEELVRISVTGNYYLLDLDMDALEGQGTFVVRMHSSSGVTSKEYVVNRVSSEELDLFIQPPDESGANNALDYLMLAGYYEENNMLIDASNFYQEAILAAPDVPDFQEYYEKFLERHSW